MNINDVYQLMDKFEGSTLSELSLELGDVKLSVKKGSVGAGVQTVVAPFSAENVGLQSTPVGVTAPSQTAMQESQTTASKTVTAPLVGTFYYAPAPGEAPFVKVGQQVKKGDVIGIIEAMKLMNEITATEDGVVEEIVVEDGSLVEYNEVLIRLS